MGEGVGGTHPFLDLLLLLFSPLFASFLGEGGGTVSVEDVEGNLSRLLPKASLPLGLQNQPFNHCLSCSDIQYLSQTNVYLMILQLRQQSEDPIKKLYMKGQKQSNFRTIICPNID